MADPVNDRSLAVVNCDVVVESIDSTSDAGLGLLLGQAQHRAQV
jgi:hypothetical protein